MGGRPRFPPEMRSRIAGIDASGKITKKGRCHADTHPYRRQKDPDGGERAFHALLRHRPSAGKPPSSGETMIWPGAILLGFIVYHLLQFTVRVTPDIIPEAVAKRPGDVYSMVIASFRHTAIALLYVRAMVVLFLHLQHGIQSFFQTLGWKNERTLPRFTAVAKGLPALFLLGYSAIPILILVGFLTK